MSMSSQSGLSRKITIIFGTQSGTAEHAAKELKSKMTDYLKRVDIFDDDINISVMAANATSPDKLIKRAKGSFVSIFMTSTFGEGGFPNQMESFWRHLNKCSDGTFESMRYSLFGLGSTMYAGFEEEMFCRAAKMLDRKLEDLGGNRIVPLGLGDDMDRRHYRDGFDRWVEALLPVLLYELEVVDSPKKLPTKDLNVAPKVSDNKLLHLKEGGAPKVSRNGLLYL